MFGSVAKLVPLVQLSHRERARERETEKVRVGEGERERLLRTILNDAILNDVRN